MPGAPCGRGDENGFLEELLARLDRGRPDVANAAKLAPGATFAAAGPPLCEVKCVADDAAASCAASYDHIEAAGCAAPVSALRSA